MPAIIQFSNDNFYQKQLLPLRQYPPKCLKPIIVRHVKDGFREGRLPNVVNRPEAIELANAIQQMCSLEEYKDKSIGVISLQGETQAQEIQKRLLSCIPPSELEKRKIVCGDAYAFQGDERDIILMSMVAAPNERIGVLNRDEDKRRFNVAASRARDQVWLFHTATLNELNPACMRSKLLKYYQNPPSPPQVEGIDLNRLRELAHAPNRRRGTQPPPFDSWFEVDVFINIIDHGFRVIPQYKVAGYRIDLLVEGAKSLAIECDGDEWHGIEQYEADVAREHILRRAAKLPFWRIRGSEYYLAPDKSLESLWETLSEMGIYPIGESGPEEERPANISPQDRGPKEEPDSKEYDNEESQPLESQLKTPHLLFELDNIVQESKVEKSKPTEDSHGSSKASSVEKKVRAAEKQKQGIKKKIIDSEIYNYSPEFFFKLSHWAKEKDMFHPWERRLIFKCGDYLQRGWKISEKMDFWLLKLIKEAKEAGFSEKAE